MKKLGVVSNTVRLVKYDKSWKRYFDAEKKKLEKIFGSSALGIEHVGSTSLDKMPAKPVIDVVLGVDVMKKGGKYQRKLEDEGYIFRPFFPTRQHRLFSKIHKNVTTHHIHMVRHKGRIWNKLLTFKKYLSEHPKTRNEYKKLKYKMMKKFVNDRGAYTKSKAKFVKEVLEKARR